MIPFGNQTVTLYHRTRTAGEDGRSRDVWARYTLKGCSWREIAAQSMEGNAVRGTVQTVCRIPAGQMKPQVGDVLIFGAVSAEIASAKELNALLEQHRDGGAFRVESVANNAGSGVPLPHYVARG